MVGMGAAEQAVIDQVYQAIFWSALVAGVVALGVGALLLRSILHPLRRLDAGVADIAQGNYGVRVTVGSDDELGRLATNFNHMAGTLEEQEALRQRMVADIAHELRTPLSVVQGNLQAILDGVFPLAEGRDSRRSTTRPACSPGWWRISTIWPRPRPAACR